jgi:Zn-dependent peptidase ImmA (M78 family)
VTARNLRIVPSWESAPGVVTSELAATWSRLTIDVDGNYATWVEKDGTPRNGIYVSAYPLAEWIAYNWWFLIAEFRVSVHPVPTWTWAAASRDSWLQRHNFRAAGSGMTWPDLTIVPEGSTTRVSWSGRRPGKGDRGLRYLSTGVETLPGSLVQESLQLFVESVIDRLRETGIADTPLDREWERIRSTDTERGPFVQAVARLGIDPYNVSQVLADHVVGLDQEMGPELLGEFLDSVDPERLDNATTWITEAENYLRNGREIHEGPQLDRNAVSRLKKSAPRSRPWEIGYDAARQVREALDWAPNERAEPEQLVGVHPLAAESGGIEGYVAAELDTVLLVPDPNTSHRRLRFQTAHALGLSVIEPSRSRFVLDPAHTELAQAARAFAAELLAPARGVNEHLTRLAGPTDTAFDAIARHFDTSAAVVRWQYENQLSGGAGD